MDLYSNPVLAADWSDPDVIYADGYYWMTASSFNRTPGLPILKSSDLVTWTHVSNALLANIPYDHYTRPQVAGGVWAPSLRFHRGIFYIVYGDPDHGIYITETDHPELPWSEPNLILPGKGLIDPCPLWDEDGRTYIVHGWARSRSGISNRLSIIEVDEPLSHVLGKSQTLINGDLLSGYKTLEGPKLYRHDDYYWVFAPAGGVADGWQSVFRSSKITGPYEERIVLSQGDTAINGPHQGAWVQTPAGEDWFLHFQSRGAFGRVVHLQPMTWGDDGWPHMGLPVDEILGKPVTAHRPPVASAPIQSAKRSREDPPTGIRLTDRFDSDELAPRWFWQANHDPSWACLRDGALTLVSHFNPTLDLDNFPGLLAQRLPAGSTRWSIIVCARDLDDDVVAGLGVLGGDYAWIGVSGSQVLMRHGRAQLVRSIGEIPRDTDVILAATIDENANLGFKWRLMSESRWQSALHTWPVTASRWTGASIGLFSMHQNPDHSSTPVDLTAFEVRNAHSGELI